ncbi:MAG: hypothetical protein ACREP9_17900 [Candidatus Dormibacteraceae bacterium]
MIKKIGSVTLKVLLLLAFCWPTAVLGLSLLGPVIARFFGTNIAVAVWLIGVGLVSLYTWARIGGMRRRRAIILPVAKVEVNCFGRRRIHKPDKAVILELEDVA